MKRKTTNKSKLVIIAIIVLIPTLLMAMIFIVPPLFHALRSGVQDCRYNEATNYFSTELEEYLNNYHRDNGHYPDSLDVSQFRIYQSEKYREIADKIEYSTDGNSFEIFWKRPTSLRQKPRSFCVLIIKGHDGKRTYFHSDIVRVKNKDN
jgi:hypothetical protein